MTLEPTAVTKLRDILAEENNPNLKLRVFVQGGGCSGFQYGFTLDEIQAEDDMNLQYDDVGVLVDSNTTTTLWGQVSLSKIPMHKPVAVADLVLAHTNPKYTSLNFLVNTCQRMNIYDSTNN
jgi:iron-sulfur cluster assembly accessory protein